jgi:hypothetical protein
MKTLINWKTFFILLGACTIGSVLVIPFQVGLNPDIADLGAIIYLGAFLQGLVMFSIVTFLGLVLAPKVGFSLPILEGENKLDTLKAILKPSIMWGILSGVLIISFALLFWVSFLELLQAEMDVPIWAGFLASFYGGIGYSALFLPPRPFKFDTLSAGI